MTDLTQEEANELIKEKIAQAHKLIKECEVLADKHSLSFSVNVGGASNVDRNIAGDYYGKGNGDHDGLYDEWSSSDENLDPGDVGHDGFWDAWTSSSEYC